MPPLVKNCQVPEYFRLACCHCLQTQYCQVPENFRLACCHCLQIQYSANSWKFRLAYCHCQNNLNGKKIKLQKYKLSTQKISDWHAATVLKLQKCKLSDSRKLQTGIQPLSSASVGATLKFIDWHAATVHKN